MTDEPITLDGAANREEIAQKRVIGRPFPPGNKANPTGRPKTKPITDALKAAIREVGKAKDKTRAQELAEMILAKALEGDAQFAKIAVQYLDGMPTQQVDATVDQTIRVIDPLAPADDESKEDVDG